MFYCKEISNQVLIKLWLSVESSGDHGEFLCVLVTNFKERRVSTFSSGLQKWMAKDSRGSALESLVLAKLICFQRISNLACRTLHVQVWNEIDRN